LTAGVSVKEYFGMNLLSVTWICRQSTEGKSLVVESPDGVPGMATDCSMAFCIQDNQVTLTMGYNPVSPLAYLATPVLIIDNWIALNILLPAAVDPRPLDSYRQLMGALYGIAGLAHFADLLLGSSTLFASVGLPTFSELPSEGQAYALLWCAVGPFAYFLSSYTNDDDAPSSPADFGLVLYGLVEVVGAYLTDNPDALVNAMAVQGIVLAAWVYSYLKQQEKQSLLL
jgi:hypothetical protein